MNLAAGILGIALLRFISYLDVFLHFCFANVEICVKWSLSFPSRVIGTPGLVPVIELACIPNGRINETFWNTCISTLLLPLKPTHVLFPTQIRPRPKCQSNVCVWLPRRITDDVITRIKLSGIAFCIYCKCFVFVMFSFWHSMRSSESWWFTHWILEIEWAPNQQVWLVWT